MQQLHSHFADRFDGIESGAGARTLAKTGGITGPATPPLGPPTPPVPAPPAPAPAPDPARQKQLDSKNKPHTGDAPAQAAEGAENLDGTHKADKNAPKPTPGDAAAHGLQDMRNEIDHQAVEDAHANGSTTSSGSTERSAEADTATPAATSSGSTERSAQADDETATTHQPRRTELDPEKLDDLRRVDEVRDAFTQYNEDRRDLTHDMGAFLSGS